eukprot:m.117577 g.117577  ORF g.117577 m.117577 type:complete len:374 (+) comp37616_c0_seq1:192-1313(+)
MPSFLWKTLLAVAVVLMAQWILLTLRRLGAFRITYKQRPGPCWTIPMNGSEDIDLLPGGVAVISSGLHDPTNRRVALPHREGKLYMFDFNQPEKKRAQEIQLIESGTFTVKHFNPHGLSHWRDAHTGETFLQVINHLVEKDIVEIFQLMPGNLVAKHFKSIHDPQFLYCLNDVAAVAKDSFYVSSDHHFETHVLRKLEEFLQVSAGKIQFYNGQTKKVHTPAGGIKYPNGVALSPDGRFVYVTSITGASLLIYGRDVQSHSLTFLQEIEYNSGCDNVFVDLTGDIWLGCHPRLLKVADCLHSTSKPCDSHVLLLKLGQESEQGLPFPDYSLEQIYYDVGDQHKASSVAVHYKGQMLVGSIFDNVLFCEVKNQE